MNFLTHTLFLAQASPDVEAVTREIGRLQRNYEFLSYGMIAAWLILAIYVLMMIGRERRLRGEIDRLTAMPEASERVARDRSADHRQPGNARARSPRSMSAAPPSTRTAPLPA